MPKIVLNRTIQYKRNTYKLGEMVDISAEDMEALEPYGEIIEEEQNKQVEVEQPKKSTKRNTKRADK